SADSDRAVDLAKRIALAQSAEIILARVAEPVAGSLASAGGGGNADDYDHFSQSDDAHIMGELRSLADTFGLGSLAVRCLVLHGPIEQALLDCERQQRPDLVVIASHGRTGLARLALGSVADRLVRDGASPVLVTPRSRGIITTPDHALVLLDGSAVAEHALPMVQEMAGRPLRRLVLFRSVRKEQDRSPATAYLEGIARRLDSSGARVEIVVDVAPDVRESVEQASATVDLIILCTHGRGGFSRLRHGSVAAHIM